MAHSAAAAAAAKRSIEMARRSGPGLDVSFVLIAFMVYRFVKRSASKLFDLPLTHFSVRPGHVKGDVHGTPWPTSDLVKATSLLDIEPSAFTSSRKLEPVTV